MFHAQRAVFVGVFLIAGLCTHSVIGQEKDGYSITGIVSNEKGEPVSDARIDISTAMPIVGPAIFCPSCYFDCRKWTVTDQSGFFKIDGLDSSLKFKVLVSAVGFQTTQSESCPVDGAQLKIALRPRRNRSNLGQMVTGLVRSEHGIAISGALVNPVSKIDSNGLRSSAGKGVGPAITDADGRFEIDLVEGVRGIDLVVAANGFCSRKFVELTPSAVHKLELEVGAAVTGRVGNMGVPVEGVSVAVAQTDHSSYREKLFQKAVPVTTDAQGKFTILNLMPSTEYCIYSVVGESKRTSSDIVIKTYKFRTPSSGKTIDLGELSTEAPVSISGRLTSEDNPLFATTKVVLKRNPAWDLIQVPVADDGSFLIAGLPSEVYEIKVASSEFELHASKIKSLLWTENSVKRLVEATTEIDLPLRQVQKSSRSNDIIETRSLSGCITVPAGQELPGIVVSANNGNSPKTTTSAKGRFSLSIPHSTTWLKLYRPDKDGMRMWYLGRIEVIDDIKNLTIPLGGESFYEPETLSN